jgi:hypothetical protein
MVYGFLMGFSDLFQGNYMIGLGSFCAWSGRSGIGGIRFSDVNLE